MRIEFTEFPGLAVITPKVHQDERGFFLETYRRDKLQAAGLPWDFTQANHARSETPGVLRGLHYQAPPTAQAKLVWVTAGEVFDVVVDIRRGSPTFGRHFSIKLTAREFTRLLVPKGFAHGYVTLTPGVEFQYMVDAYYSPAHEEGIAWDDPDLGIDWPVAEPLLSGKDKLLPRLKDIVSPFSFSGGEGGPAL